MESVFHQSKWTDGISLRLVTGCFDYINRGQGDITSLVGHDRGEVEPTEPDLKQCGVSGVKLTGP